MSAELTTAERLKFTLMAEGASVTAAADAALSDIVDGGQWSPDDYASTRGLILRLDDDVWVNVPVERYNANFVPGTSMTVDLGPDGFFVHGRGLESRAEFWPPASFHFDKAANGRPYWNYVVTHGDRSRLSPTIGCAMVCDFCNIPFDDTYAGVKPMAPMLEALQVALADGRQPGHHILISGGTPGPKHIPGLQRVYETVLESFAGIPVDIMMVPLPGLFDLPRLDRLGVNELSINLEVYDEDVAAKVMRHKHRQGRQYYLDFLEEAAGALGGNRVRSMLMVGIESSETTLDGVRAILERGCVPVLSPFKPDPATPLAASRPPTAEETLDVYLRARDIAAELGGSLGPTCPPCTHNTLSFATKDADGARYDHALPVLHSGV
ncbi:radical SAM protein [Microbacterium sp. P5_E9]